MLEEDAPRNSGVVDNGDGGTSEEVTVRNTISIVAAITGEVLTSRAFHPGGTPHSLKRAIWKKVSISPFNQTTAVVH